MRFSIRQKLNLFFGVMLLALSVLGFSTFIQTGRLETQLRHFTEVDEPASATSLAMAIRTTGAAYTLFQYVLQSDKTHLTESKEQQAEFERLSQEYQRLASTAETQRLGTNVKESFHRFKLLADELVQVAGKKSESVMAFHHSIERLNALLAQRARNLDAGAQETEVQKEKLTLQLQAQAAKLEASTAAALQHSSGAEEGKTPTPREESVSPRLLSEFRALPLSTAEAQWIGQVNEAYGETAQLASSLLESGKALTTKILEVDTAHDTLHQFLAEDVQRAVHAEIDQGKLASLRGVEFLRTMVWILFALGVLAGLLTSVAISRSINTQQKTVQEAIARLQSISSEILASTTQQARGMEEQNASVSETVTTMSELGQTIDEAAERASVVREVVKRTVEAGNSGREAVQKSVTAMDKVRQQVNSIAKNNLDLAERAQAIGEIISTVNDVTDQTNLLALNAAVEAARAGEYGKGFGVVAAEIKSLAEQSRQATQQVSQILGDIQKATNAAVLATEQGTRDADETTRVVQEAGEAITLLSHSLEESSRMAAQISASSGQQAVGIKQVCEAMGHLETVAREQVAATRQVEAAMADLQSLSHQLGDLVDERGNQTLEALSHVLSPISHAGGTQSPSTRIARFSPTGKEGRSPASHREQRAA